MSRETSPTIWCLITFLSAENGGRLRPLGPGALQGLQYRPHLVAGDPQGCQAAACEKNNLAQEYLGVAFVDATGEAEPGQMLLAEILLLYPGVDYGALLPGATFTIREGLRIVGYGEVIG